MCGTANRGKKINTRCWARYCIWALVAAVCLGRCPGVLFGQLIPEAVHWEIPKTWDETELKAWTIPARESGAYTVHVAPPFYYSIPATPIYKSYPVYHPSKEPPGYLQWLRTQDPQVIFDPSRLRTEAEWIAAGKLVFETPRGDVPVESFRDLRWYKELKIPLTADGVIPGWRYVVRKKGLVEAGTASCSACHSRVMPDGSLLNGAQSNFPKERDYAWDIRMRRNLEDARKYTSGLFGLSLTTGRFSFLEEETAKLDVDQIAGIHEAIPPGVVLRSGVSVSTPVKIADLIGVRDRKYLDLIARVRHRNIGDMMRYAAFDPGGVVFFADRNAIPDGMLPDPATLTRFSDEQLFALSLYIYSLQPPRNPNRFDAVARRGQRLFEKEGCPGCHTPPLYTNNKLTLAGDFVPPRGLLKVRHPAGPRRRRSAFSHASHARHGILQSPITQGLVVPRPVRTQWLDRNAGRLVRPQAIAERLRSNRIHWLRCRGACN